MPTRYGSPDATMRTLPHRQPPVNRSTLRLLSLECFGVAMTTIESGSARLSLRIEEFRRNVHARERRKRRPFGFESRSCFRLRQGNGKCSAQLVSLDVIAMLL